jgi:hypothetical protein
MLNNAQQPRVNLRVLKRYVGVCLYIEHTTRYVYYRSLVVEPATLSQYRSSCRIGKFTL